MTPKTITATTLTVATMVGGGIMLVMNRTRPSAPPSNAPTAGRKFHPPVTFVVPTSIRYTPGDCQAPDRIGFELPAGSISSCATWIDAVDGSDRQQCKTFVPASRPVLCVHLPATMGGKPFMLAGISRGVWINTQVAGGTSERNLWIVVARNLPPPHSDVAVVLMGEVRNTP